MSQRLKNFFKSPISSIMGMGRNALLVAGLVLTAAVAAPAIAQDAATVDHANLRAQLIQIAEQDPTVQAIYGDAKGDRNLESARLVCGLEQAGDNVDAGKSALPLDHDKINDCAAERLVEFADEMDNEEAHDVVRCMGGLLAREGWDPDSVDATDDELRACGLGWLIDFWGDDEDDAAYEAKAAAPAPM